MRIVFLFYYLISLTPHTHKVFWTQYYIYKSFKSNSPVFIINEDGGPLPKIVRNIYCRSIELEKFKEEKNIILGQLVIHKTYRDTVWQTITKPYWELVRNSTLIYDRLNRFFQGEFQNLRRQYNLTFYENPRVWKRNGTMFFQFKITSPRRLREERECQSQLRNQIRRLFPNNRNYKFINLQISFNKGKVVQLEQLRDVWIVRGRLKIFQKKFRYIKRMKIRTYNKYLSILGLEDKSLSWLDSIIVHDWKVFKNVKLYEFRNNKIPVMSYQKNTGIIPIIYKNLPEIEKSFYKKKLFLIFHFDTKYCKGL